MKKCIKATWKKIRSWKKITQIVFAVFAFGFLSFSALSVLAFSDWYFNHRTSQPITRQTNVQENKNETIPANENISVQDVGKSTSIKQSNLVKPSDTGAETSPSDAEEIERLKQLEQQTKEYSKQAEASLDNLNKTLSNQVVAPPTVKPINVSDFDTTITAPTPPKVHTTKTCWDDTLLGRQCKTTMSVY